MNEHQCFPQNGVLDEIISINYGIQLPSQGRILNLEEMVAFQVYEVRYLELDRGKLPIK